MPAFGGRTSHGSAALAVASHGDARTSLLTLLSAVSPPPTRASHVSYGAALVVYGNHSAARVSLTPEIVVYTTGVPYASQSLAWTFSLDGHTFYVLDLGNQGTFLFDTTTQAWCQFQTQGNAGWNFRNGVMWWTNGAPRIVGGDSTGVEVWELDPTQMFDEGWRDIPHAATAGIMLRSRVYRSMAELRIAASAGLLDDTTGAAYIQLTWSDDGGQTYQGPVIVQLTVGTTPDGQQDIRFSSLGSFMAPGRVLQIEDVGGILRLDGVDAMIDDYDGGADMPESGA